MIGLTTLRQRAELPEASEVSGPSEPSGPSELRRSEPAEGSPLASLFPEPAELLGGLGGVAFAVLILPLALFGLAQVGALLGGDSAEEAAAAAAAEEPPPAERIEARLVALGSLPDPRRLPTKALPRPEAARRHHRASSAAPAEASAPLPEDPSSAPRLEEPQAEPSTQADAQAQTQTDAQTDAQTQTEPQAEPQPEPSSEPAPESDSERGEGSATDGAAHAIRGREGDPDGVPEGDQSRAEGDLYLGQLYAYFRRGWQVPTFIPDAELRGLACVVELRLTPDLRVGPFRLAQASGNEAFDGSVRARMAQAEGAPAPQPPAGQEGRFLGRPIRLRFIGRNAR